MANTCSVRHYVKFVRIKDSQVDEKGMLFDLMAELTCARSS